MKKLIEKIKNLKSKINLKYVHIGIIILGTIFIALPIFHSNLWFDEAYSVALARHSFKDIWIIGGNDVHPILYYMILHIINLIFGNNSIIAYRIFSTLCISLMSLLGFTHIRKDFGEKTGFIFSFLTLFLPVSGLFSSEIRMYTLGMLLGTIMAIYAYRIWKGKIYKSTFVLFGLSSLAVAYTHYYGLMLAGLVNGLLFLYLLFKVIKNRKNKEDNKVNKKNLITFLIVAAVQIIAYIPWLVCFLTQLKGVSSGFWISLSFPNTLYEIITTQFKGNLPMNVALIITAICYIYIVARIVIMKIRKEEIKHILWCFATYFSIIIIALLISLIMHSVILLWRYLIIITGLFIFAMSYLMANEKKGYVQKIICIVILITSSISMTTNINQAYNSNNQEFMDYLKKHVNKGDIIVYSNVINGAVVMAELSQEKDNVSYFYNKEHWGVEEAYKAFSPYMIIKENLDDILKDFGGRIWIIESGNTSELYNEIKEKYNIGKENQTQFRSEYKEFTYTIGTLEILK